METCLVTGGAGFIGSNLVRKLLDQGYKVRVFDDFSTGRRENILDLETDIELIESDLRDFPMVQRSMLGVDYVLHQGALPSVPRSVSDPVRSNDVNVNGTLNVLIAARDARVKRVVYASSSSVYGGISTLPWVETMSPLPISPYAASKLAAEHYAQVFYKVYSLETVGLRYFNVFGPRQDPTSHYSAAIPKFVISMLGGKSPVIYGDGKQSRDFTFVDNVVKANLLAIEAEEGVTSEVFNVSCGESYSILDLINTLSKILDVDIKPVFESNRKGDVKHSLADISKARDILGFEAEVRFEQGLKKTVEWYKERF